MSGYRTTVNYKTISRIDVKKAKRRNMHGASRKKISKKKAKNKAS